MSVDQENKTNPNLDLEKLRQLILQPELEKISQLQDRLDNKQNLAEEISHVLPAAIEQSSERNENLGHALSPTVQDAVKESIANDLPSFADALYPVMGPAIRRSISENFKEMIQSMNVALENSFSKQGLLWRIESIRTGRPFSEIVLLRSLVYRVEQVFLIHRETGGLLQHVSTNLDGDQDADMVSGMLTAISDFVKDSFTLEGQSVLDSIQIDDLTVLIEPGPLAIIAIAIRGNAPNSIRDDVSNALELIHHQQLDALSKFDGDSAPFEESRHFLEDCIKTQYKEKEEQNKGKKAFPVKLAIISVGLILFICWWAYGYYRDQAEWNNYLNKLKDQPGIVITDVAEIDGQYHIIGLKDPLAINPQQLRTESTPVSEDKISFQLEPYQALSNDFILKRATSALAKPAQIQLTLKDGMLKAEGQSSYLWKQQAAKLAPLIAGVAGYDDSAVNNADIKALNPPATVNLIFEEGMLHAKGSASYRWIKNTRRIVKTIPGINKYDDTAVTVLEVRQINELIQLLEQKTILFQVKTSKQAMQQLKEYAIVQDIKHLIKLTKILGKQILINIVGHTDDSGSFEKNLQLSQKRANSIYQYFLKNGLPAIHLNAQGIGSSKPLGNDPSGLDKELNRSVTFSVDLTDH